MGASRLKRRKLVFVCDLCKLELLEKDSFLQRMQFKVFLANATLRRLLGPKTHCILTVLNPLILKTYKTYLFEHFNT